MWSPVPSLVAFRSWVSLSSGVWSASPVSGSGDGRCRPGSWEVGRSGSGRGSVAQLSMVSILGTTGCARRLLSGQTIWLPHPHSDLCGKISEEGLGGRSGDLSTPSSCLLLISSKSTHMLGKILCNHNI